MSKIINCECGELVKGSYIKNHLTSKRHNDLLNGLKVAIYTPTDRNKLECECGGKIAKDSIYGHERTLQHKSYMNTNEGEDYIICKVIKTGINSFSRYYDKKKIKNNINYQVNIIFSY